jgi:hypothetical protein
VIPPGGLYCVLGDARWDDRSIYGLTPDELRRRFGERDGWQIAFAEETVFERRFSRNRAFFVGLRRV